MASKVFSVIPYTIISPFVPSTKSLCCSLSKHFTFTSLSSSDFALHAFLSLNSRFVQDLLLSLLCSTLLIYSFSQPFSTQTLHMLKPFQTHPRHSNTDSAPHFLHLSILVTSHILRTDFISITCSLPLIYPHTSSFCSIEHS